MHKKQTIIYLVVILFFSILLAKLSFAAETPKQMKGRFYLQVEQRGKIWYINPRDGKKYEIYDNKLALDAIAKTALGITKENINKIPTYEPKKISNQPLAKRFGGYFLLVTNERGGLWYVDPQNFQRYQVTSTQNLLTLAKNNFRGIKDSLLNTFPTGHEKLVVILPPISTPPITPPPTPSTILGLAAEAVRQKNDQKALTYFTNGLKLGVEYGLNTFNNDSRLLFANLLSGATLYQDGATEKIYTIKTYFGMASSDVTLKFHIQKQLDNTWLISKI